MSARGLLTKIIIKQQRRQRKRRRRKGQVKEKRRREKCAYKWGRLRVSLMASSRQMGLFFIHYLCYCAVAVCCDLELPHSTRRMFGVWTASSICCGVLTSTMGRPWKIFWWMLSPWSTPQLTRRSGSSVHLLLLAWVSLVSLILCRIGLSRSLDFACVL